MKEENIWNKAAVVGGLWASFEIVIGSFLHNLHIPFSGSILTFFATILMISFYQVWPVKGLIWRAGLICALMKSVSPSGVILGPMTGIFLEALLADLFLRLIGNNLAGYLIAGMASQISPLIHKVVNLLIRYGNDIVRIYENMFEFAIRQFKNIELTPRQAITFVVLIYAAMGILAAGIGIRAGRQALRKKGGEKLNVGPAKPSNQWSSVAPGQHFYLPLLFIHMIALPVFLFVFNRYALHPLNLILFLCYELFCLLWYKRIKYRLLKPLFWIHLLVIGAFAGFFWNSADTDTASSSMEGWVMGGSLILRAILVITGFSALSAELRNPKLTGFLYKFGFKKIYDAVSMAFSVLPLMMESGAGGKALITNPGKALQRFIINAEQWLYVIQQSDRDSAAR